MLKVRDFSLTQKLTWMNLLVSGAALLLAAGAFITYEAMLYRQSMVRELSIRAEILGANCVSAVVFDDPNSAQQTLSALRAGPHIVSAWVFSPDGKPFAGYWRGHATPAPRLLPIPDGQTESYSFKDGYLSLVRSVAFGGKPAATIYIQSDLQEMSGREIRFVEIGCVVMLASLLLAVLVSAVARRVISRPIHELAETARAVSRDKNYALRARPLDSRDEIALLIEAFNSMLEQIQKQDGELRKSAANLAEAQRIGHIGNWEWDYVEDKAWWSDELHRIFGVAPENFVPSLQSTLAYTHPEDRGRLEAALKESSSGVRPLDVDYRLIRPDGTERMIHVQGELLPDKTGKPQRMVGIAQDITERQRAENELRRLNEELEQRVEARTAELQAINKELEAFTYSVSHDLRAPLRHIDGFSRLLKEELGPSLDSTTQHYLQRIQDGTSNMGRLVDDLLNLARIGRRELNRQVTGLDSVVKEVLVELKPETREREIEWQLGQLPFVECDPSLMKQVFLNLLSNACKYTRPRKPAVIEVGQSKRNGEAVVFVRDNGVGFSMKYADKLFGVFQRLHRAEDFEGTGVGLATVQRIIHKHGGHVWAEAELDRGATFYFTLGGADKAPVPNRAISHEEG